MTFYVHDGFIQALKRYQDKVHQWAALLDEHQFWSKPFPYGNSFGHLLLHLTGNLNFYLGAYFLNTGYIRNRDLEFTDPNPPSKVEALAKFDAAVEVAIRAIETQSSEDWGALYKAEGMPEGMSNFDAVMQCVAHVFHHVGQMIYIQKQWDQLPQAARLSDAQAD